MSFAARSQTYRDMYTCIQNLYTDTWLIHLTKSNAADVESNPHAKRLYDDLLHDYNRLIRCPVRETHHIQCAIPLNPLCRPVNNFSETLTVKLGLRLSQLIDVVI